MVLNTMYCIRKEKTVKPMVLNTMYCIRKENQLNLWY